MSVRTHPTPPANRTASAPGPYVWAAGRLCLGWIFLWAFLDKLLGLGKSTSSGWLDGTSPSAGFLSHVEGPFRGMFHSMAGQTWVDAAYMFGLGGLGLALMLGVGLRIAAVGGTLLLAMLWAASLPLEKEPLTCASIVLRLEIRQRVRGTDQQDR